MPRSDQRLARDERLLPLKDIQKGLRYYTSVPVANPEAGNARISHESFQHIATLLSHLEKHDADARGWSEVPRTYTVLKNINHLHDMQTFIKHRMTDYMLPYTYNTFPQGFDSVNAQKEFLAIQEHVLTDIRQLEAEDRDVHLNISGNADRHFFSLSKLGHGSSG